ncbi:unnamed protein product, partial [Ixodes persulcatus]
NVFADKKLDELQTDKAKKAHRDGLSLSKVNNDNILPSPNGVSHVTNSPIETSDCAVINLSDTPLTFTECSVLSRGLSFVPTPHAAKEFELLDDLQQFSRRLHLQTYFNGKEGCNETRVLDSTTPNFKLKSHWTPDSSKTSVYIDNYVQAIRNDIFDSLAKATTQRGNLSRREQQVLTNLKSREDVIIRPADKGGGVVVMNRADYMREALTQLENPNFYLRLPDDPTKRFSIIINRTLEDLRNSNKINGDQYNYLQSKNAHPGVFYMLIKVHKPNNPGRPIISGIGTPTERISEFVDHAIKHIPPLLQSYVKDTTHFLNLIDHMNGSGLVSQESILVTIDVSSLYTNIPHNEGLAAVEEFLSLYPSSLADSSCILRLLELILDCNNFMFDDEHYLQIQGAAMGSRMSPNYANIFMGKFEETFVWTYAKIPAIYLRYIDDIFIIWNDTEDALLSFLSYLNGCHRTIKFTCNYSADSMNFLDVNVKKIGSHLVTELYRKPTDKRQVLRYDSYHPKCQKNNIPYSQFLRLRRICSEESNFRENVTSLKNTLFKRKYPASILDDATRKASALERSTLLESTRRPHSNETRVPLVINYYSNLSSLNSILKRHLNILHADDKLKKIFPESPFVTFRKHRNLGRMLCPSYIKKPSSCGGCGPCLNTPCQLCPFVLTADKISSYASDFYVNIKQHIDCKTPDVIYIINCTLCEKQYVGETKNSMKERFYGHKSDIVNKVQTPVAKHFNSDDHDIHTHLKIIIVESSFKNDITRKNKESFYISKFKTLTPLGMNISKGNLYRLL